MPLVSTLLALCNHRFCPLPARSGQPSPWRRANGGETGATILAGCLVDVRRGGHAYRRFRLQGVWFRLYCALHAAERERVGREVDPSAAVMDAQSVKTGEESAGISGYDGGKQVKGRKRHLLVDTLGLPIAISVTPADLSDPAGARKLLSGLAFRVPRLHKIWADMAYRGKELADWCRHQGAGWELEVVEHKPGTRGFQVQPRRWVVERSFVWLIRHRRLAKDYERKVQTSETLIEIAATCLVLRRLASRA